MAIAFRAIATNTPSGSATNTTVTKPTGTVDGDVMIAAIYVEDNVAISAVPTGWTQITNFDHSAVNYDVWVYWKRASSEGANYTWNHTSAWELGAIASYSGCVAAGDPQDGTVSVNSGTSTTATASSITTATDGAMLVGIYNSFEGIAAQTAASLPAPFTNNERYDAADDLYWTDGVQAAAGASGTKALPNALSASNHWGAILVALKPDTGAAAKPKTLMTLGVG